MGIIKKNTNVHPKDSKGLIHKAGNKYKYFLKVGQCTPWVYMWCTWSGVHFPAAYIIPLALRGRILPLISVCM